MARMAIVGTGWGSRVQVPLFREAGLELAGIVGSDRSRTEQLTAELGVPSFADWREAVASDADVVSIVVPPSEHLEIATAALEAGKHVINEKPTALNASEAERLLEAAQRTPERIAIIDHELRFLPAWQAARERIGELGPLRYIELRYASPSRGDRKREWNWWSDAARGGGIWGAVGSHCIDTIRYLGFEIEGAQAVMRSTIAERPFGEGTRPVTSDDFTSVHLRLHGGALATLTFSVVSAGPDEPAVMTLHGEHGAFRMIGEELLHSTERAPFRRIAGGDLQKLPGNSPGGAFGTGTFLLGRALRAAIDEGDRTALSVAATFSDGLAQQRVLDAARASAAGEGSWVSVSSD